MVKYLGTSKKINEYLCTQDPVFIEIINKCKSVQVELKKNYFVVLIETIVSQQLSNKVSAIISERLQVLCNNIISPTIILELSNEELRGVGISYSKVAYIKSLAEAVVNGKVGFEDIENMEKDDVIEMLTSVKGIGQWTAEMFLIFSLGREDVFSKGDGALQRAIINTYNIESKLTKALLNEISDNWKPYRTYASLYLWDMINKSII